jgi:hypothetical protein
MAQHLILSSPELLPANGMHTAIANGVFKIQKEGAIAM